MHSGATDDGGRAYDLVSMEEYIGMDDYVVNYLSSPTASSY